MKTYRIRLRPVDLNEDQRKAIGYHFGFKDSKGNPAMARLDTCRGYIAYEGLGGLEEIVHDYYRLFGDEE